MSTEKKWYVYLLCDPDTELPFYVGKGTEDRMDHHDKYLNAQSDGNLEKRRIIKRILAQGKQVLKKKIAEFDSEQDAYIYEWAMISLYGSYICNVQIGKSRLHPQIKREKQEEKPYAGEPAIDLKGAAEILMVSEQTARKMARAIGGFQVGVQWRFFRSDIESYLDRLHDAAAQSAG